MAIADVYDALISERVYKRAFSHQEARDIIVEGRGSQFDPAIVDAFIACEAEFQAIADQFDEKGFTIAQAAWVAKEFEQSQYGLTCLAI